MTTEFRPRIGDHVKLTGGTPLQMAHVYEVKRAPQRVNEKRFTLQPLDGGYTVRAAAGLLRQATAEEVAAAKAAAPETRYYTPGEVVTVNWKTIPADQPMVVLSDPGKDRVKVAKLGGNDGGGWIFARPLVQPATLADLRLSTG